MTSLTPRRCRTALAALAVLAALASAGGCAPPPRPGVPPRHVLLITVAGLRADHCSAYQYPLETTTIPEQAPRETGPLPTIDQLAHEGVLFAQAFAPADEALVSLAALFTGRSPLATGTLAAGDPLAPEETTLAELLGAAGFETAAFVARPTTALPPGFDQGFDHFESAPDDPAVLGRATAFLDERDFGDGRPLLVWIHLEGPEHVDAPPSPPAAAPYDEELARTTRRLATFLDYLRYRGATAGFWGATLTVLCGTDGVELAGGAGGGGGPGNGDGGLRDGTLRVPLLIRHPDSLTGRRILREVVELADVAPTLVDWFGLEAPPMEGRSLLSLTDSHPRRPFPRRAAFGLAPGSGDVTLRNGSWRLIAGRAEDGTLLPRALYPVSIAREGSRVAPPPDPDPVGDLLQELRAWLDAHPRP